MALTFEEFAQLVHEMREAQKKFFLTGERVFIARAKSLERKVDRALDDLFDSQLKLF